MKTMIKYFALAVVALALPLSAQSATAAEMRQPGQAIQSLNGSAAKAPFGVLAQTKTEPQKIVVAGRGGRIGAAIVGGIVAGALISGAVRAHEYDRRRYYYRDRYSNRCDRWLWKCENGHRWACHKYDDYCD